MMIAFRLIHIFAAAFWAGAMFFVVSFLFPSFRDAGPESGAVVRQLLGVRKFPRAMFIVAVVTTLSGFALYGLNVSLSNGAFARSRAGMIYGLGGIAALVAMIVGATVVRPTAARLALLASRNDADEPTADQVAEIDRLRARMTAASGLAAASVAVAVVTMAVARYL